MAGFIGYSLALRSVARGDTVYGIDNMNDYYDVKLKEARVAGIGQSPNFTFQKLDIVDRKEMSQLFGSYRFDSVVHLAAQAGVRYSIENPYAYIDGNLVGFCNILEGCRQSKVGHLLFASSSSVYGANTKMPFSERDHLDHPVSLYGATKKANELMAHAYSSLYNLPVTGLRFFTVYGPWGRPDMALFLFTKAILEGKSIEVFNQGKMKRSFTYIDDVIEGVIRVMDQPAESDPGWKGDSPDPASSYAPYRIYNIGNNEAVELMRYIQALEACLGKKAKMRMLPMQAGDVPATMADIKALVKAVGYKPHTSIKVGIKRFVDWYKAYYQV